MNTLLSAQARRMLDHPEEREQTLHNLSIVAIRMSNNEEAFNEIMETIMWIHALNFTERSKKCRQ